MLLNVLILALWSVSVGAFLDASPFILQSTSALEAESIPGPHIAQAKDVDVYLHAVLDSCPTRTYVIVRQPGVSAADLSGSDAAPHLVHGFAGYNGIIKTKVAVSNVRGLDASSTLSEAVARRCKISVTSISDTDEYLQLDKTPSVVDVALTTLPRHGQKRLLALNRQDAFVNEVIKRLSTQNYTLIYLTTPVQDATYEAASGQEQMYMMEESFPSGMHMDIKRDMSSAANTEDGPNINSDVPLFEKYQFVNSAIFMTVAVSLLLLFILSVGLRAISGLEVSYMAFSKEMNPTAQKKQQ